MNNFKFIEENKEGPGNHPSGGIKTRQIFSYH